MKKGKMRKIVTIFTIIAIGLVLTNIGVNYLIPICLSYRFLNEAEIGSSVGIIGGADGPTAIFVTSQSSHKILNITLIIFSIAGVLYLLFSKKVPKQ